MQKIKELNEIFKCKFCLQADKSNFESDSNETLEDYEEILTDERVTCIIKDPIILPCGETICKKHSKEISAKACIFCFKYHLEPEKGYISNNAIKKMIELEVNKIGLQSQIDNNSFKKEIDEIKKCSGQIDLINQTIYTHACVLKAKLENSLKDLPDESTPSSECVNLSLNREYLLFNKPKVIIFMLKIFFLKKMLNILLFLSMISHFRIHLF